MDSETKNIKREITEEDLQKAREKYAKKSEEKIRQLATPTGEINEFEIMIPVMKFKEYEIHPWSLKKLKLLRPYIDKIIPELKKEKITVENVNDKIIPLCYALMDTIADIIAISLDIPLEDAEKFNIGEAAQIVLKIIMQNMTYLKNYLSLVQVAIKGALGNTQT